MNKKTVFFNDAPRIIAKIIADAKLPSDVAPIIIRDIQGRLRVALDSAKSIDPKIALQLAASMKELGAFAGPSERSVLLRKDFFDPDSIFMNKDVLDVYLPDLEKPIRVLDRQITGQDWLHPENRGTAQGKPPRLVFFGLKGGVGRSTALTMLAHQLARSGKRVLLIDLDLESPGLSGLLLPPDRLADFGLVDWFVEDAVGQGEVVLGRMVSVSPLSEHTQGEIRVAAAMGIEEHFYLAKLSRVYADKPEHGRIERFSQRVHRLVNLLEAQEKPDVVLIDSRAGLHDLAAVSIVGLATFAFLFTTDTAQAWQGYRLLFSHWQAHPTVLHAVWIGW